MSSKAATRLRVKDVMSRNPICVGLSTSAQELAEILEANDISGVPVVDMQERVVGVVSKTDLIHRCVDGPAGAEDATFFSALAQGMAPGGTIEAALLGSVEEFMSGDPVTANVDEPVSTIARRMAEERVHRVVVVDDEQTVLGMVTPLDLLKVFPE